MKRDGAKERQRLISLPGLRGATLRVLLVIHAAGERCFKRQATIASEVGADRCTVNRAIRRLAELGLIAGERRGCNTTSVWWVDWRGVDEYLAPSLFGPRSEDQEDRKMSHPEVTKCHIRMLQNVTSGSDEMSHPKSHPHSNKELNPPSKGFEREIPSNLEAIPGEAREHRAGSLVRLFYDGADMPMPAANILERDLDVVLRHAGRHGESIVAAALRELPSYLRSNEHGCEFLFAAEAQLAKVIRRVKGRGPLLASRNEPRRESDPDAWREDWMALSDGERRFWVEEARRSSRVLRSLPDGNYMLEQMANQRRQGADSRANV